jgi:uncharacterized repeat protein (TIGR03847 family)
MMIDFGVVQHIEAQSTGDPGRRTFHLRILGEAGQSASLKLEKEHLLALRVGLHELLAQARYEGKLEVAGVVYSLPAPDYDFPVGRLGLGFSSADRKIVLEAGQLEAEGDQGPIIIGARFTPEQGASLAAQLEEIIAAGRPICPLCRTPIEPEGHICVKSNGHSRQPIPDEHPDQE